MIISESKKFIFIHVNKNGGSSIRSILSQHQEGLQLFLLRQKIDRKIRWKKSENEWRLYGRELLSKLNRFLPMRYKMVHFHEGISELKAGNAINKYYKFCIIREPMDRLESMFFYELKRDHSILHNLAKKGIDEFVRVTIQNKLLIRQWDLVSIDGKFALDDYILFEDIDQGFGRIAEKIGVNNPTNGVPHVNSGSRKPVELSMNSVKLIREYFSEDFKLYDQAASQTLLSNGNK